MIEKVNIKFPKLIVTGHKGHGKDEVCNILCNLYGLNFKSSSEFAIDKVVTNEFMNLYGYKDTAEVMANKDKHRHELFQMISAYNTPDKARLGTELFAEYDIYCGLRNQEELVALEAMHPELVIVWVDARNRKQPEGTNSCTVTKEDAHYVLDNNGTLDDLLKNVSILGRFLSMCESKLDKQTKRIICEVKK